MRYLTLLLLVCVTLYANPLKEIAPPGSTTKDLPYSLFEQDSHTIDGIDYMTWASLDFYNRQASINTELKSYIDEVNAYTQQTLTIRDYIIKNWQKWDYWERWLAIKPILITAFSEKRKLTEAEVQSIVTALALPIELEQRLNLLALPNKPKLKGAYPVNPKNNLKYADSITLIGKLNVPISSNFSPDLIGSDISIATYTYDRTWIVSGYRLTNTELQIPTSIIQIDKWLNQAPPARLYGRTPVITHSYPIRALFIADSTIESIQKCTMSYSYESTDKLLKDYTKNIKEDEGIIITVDGITRPTIRNYCPPIPPLVSAVAPELTTKVNPCIWLLLHLQRPTPNGKFVDLISKVQIDANKFSMSPSFIMWNELWGGTLKDTQDINSLFTEPKKFVGEFLYKLLIPEETCKLDCSIWYYSR